MEKAQQTIKKLQTQIDEFAASCGEINQEMGTHLVDQAEIEDEDRLPLLMELKDAREQEMSKLKDEQWNNLQKKLDIQDKLNSLREQEIMILVSQQYPDKAQLEKLLDQDVVGLKQDQVSSVSKQFEKMHIGQKRVRDDESIDSETTKKRKRTQAEVTERFEKLSLKPQVLFSMGSSQTKPEEPTKPALSPPDRYPFSVKMSVAKSEPDKARSKRLAEALHQKRQRPFGGCCLLYADKDQLSRMGML